MSASTTGVESRMAGEAIALPLFGFIALNVFGGSAVLASYVWGVTSPGVGAALWGGVPEVLRPLYTVNMFAAAAGYFAFTAVALRRWTGTGTGLLHADRTGRIGLAYALILVASALWVPLTAWMLAAPSTAVWALVRIDLALVASGCVGLVFELVLRPAYPGTRDRVWAALGLLPFGLQTIVLDALVWPHYFDLG